MGILLFTTGISKYLRVSFLDSGFKMAAGKAVTVIILNSRHIMTHIKQTQ